MRGTSENLQCLVDNMGVASAAGGKSYSDLHKKNTPNKRWTWTEKYADIPFRRLPCREEAWERVPCYADSCSRETGKHLTPCPHKVHAPSIILIQAVNYSLVNWFKKIWGYNVKTKRIVLKKKDDPQYNIQSRASVGKYTITITFSSLNLCFSFKKAFFTPDASVTNLSCKQRKWTLANWRGTFIGKISHTAEN